MKSEVYKELLIDIVDAYDVRDKAMLERKLKKASIALYNKSELNKSLAQTMRKIKQESR